MTDKKFFLAQDGSSHWYLVPAEKRKAWGKWVNIPEDDERSWDIPKWAYALGGDPSQVEFTNPSYNGVLI